MATATAVTAPRPSRARRWAAGFPERETRVALLFILNRRDRLPLTILACALLYLEAILTASQFVIGIAFAILVPIIGIGLVRPHVRGRWSVLAYAGAGISATVAVALVEAGVPTNSIESDAHVLTVVAFGLVAAASLGLLWRAGEQQARALAARVRASAARERPRRGTQR